MTSTLINDRISSAAVLRRGNLLARTEAVSLIMSSDTRKACGLRNVALNSLCSFPRNAIPETRTFASRRTLTQAAPGGSSSGPARAPPWLHLASSHLSGSALRVRETGSLLDEATRSLPLLRRGGRCLSICRDLSEFALEASAVPSWSLLRFRPSDDCKEFLLYQVWRARVGAAGVAFCIERDRRTPSGTIQRLSNPCRSNRIELSRRPRPRSRSRCLRRCGRIAPRPTEASRPAGVRSRSRR